MLKNSCVYLLYRVGKSAMQSGLVKKDLWALVPKNSKGVEFMETTYSRTSQGTFYFESKELAIKHCTDRNLQYVEMPDVSGKKLRLKSYTNTINGVQD